MFTDETMAMPGVKMAGRSYIEWIKRFVGTYI